MPSPKTINLSSAQHVVPKAVVFDMGGVLIDLHSEDAGRELTEKYGLLSTTIARLTRSCFDSHPRSITELAMTGQVGTTEYLEAFLRECSIKDLDGLRLNRLSVVGRERTNVFTVVEELKRAGLVCCVLSNTIALHWEKLTAANEYPSLALFDHVFASHLIKCAKPERASFLFVADALNISMSECLLVDDTPLNVDCAKAAGWQALLFSDATQLRLKLSHLLHTEPSHQAMQQTAPRSVTSHVLATSSSSQLPTVSGAAPDLAFAQTAVAQEDLYRLSAHAAIIGNECRVLLIKSAYGSFGWELPGGALEPGETARECVERECREELGQRISVGPLTGIYYHKVHKSHAFILRADLSGTQIVLSVEHTAFRHFALEELSAVQRVRVEDALRFNGEVIHGKF